MEELIMAKHYDKQFKLDAIEYYLNHKDLGLQGCASNLGINKAKARRKIDLPLIIHSDRAGQYVSREYKKATLKMQLSYSKKAFPWDNACIESFHSLLKREWINRFKISDYKQVYRLVFEYIEAFYNTKRIHSYCGYIYRAN